MGGGFQLLKPAIQLLPYFMGSGGPAPQLLAGLGHPRAISLGRHQPQHSLCNACPYYRPHQGQDPTSLGSKTEWRADR